MSLLVVGLFVLLTGVLFLSYRLYSGQWTPLAHSVKQTQEHHMVFMEHLGDFVQIDSYINTVSNKLDAINVTKDGVIVIVDWHAERFVKKNESRYQIGFTVLQNELETIHENCPELGYQVLPSHEADVYSFPLKSNSSFKIALIKLHDMFLSKKKTTQRFSIIFQEGQVNFIIKR